MTSADVQLINISFAKACTSSSTWLIRSTPKHRARLTIKHSDVRESADLGTEKGRQTGIIIQIIHSYTFSRLSFTTIQ